MNGSRMRLPALRRVRGRIRGPLPETRTLGFRFSAVNSMFLPVKDIGVDCWEARENPDEVDAEKKLTQFVFALPYVAPGLDEIKFKPEEVEKRQTTHPKGVVPPSCIGVTIGMDVGKYRCHWVAIAWVIHKAKRFGVIIDYGTIHLKVELDATQAIKQQSPVIPVEKSMTAMLKELRNPKKIELVGL